MVPIVVTRFKCEKDKKTNSVAELAETDLVGLGEDNCQSAHACYILISLKIW